MQCSIKKYQIENKKKREIFKNYYENLKSNKNIKFFKFYNSETPWFIDIYFNNREKLIKHLKSKNIITRKVYPSISSQKIYKKKFKLENCEKICKTGLWLPSSLNLKNKDIKKISDEINNFYS